MQQVHFQLRCPTGAPSWAVLSFRPTIQGSLYTICFRPNHQPLVMPLPQTALLYPELGPSCLISACCRVALEEGLSALPPRAAAPSYHSSLPPQWCCHWWWHTGRQTGDEQCLWQHGSAEALRYKWKQEPTNGRQVLLFSDSCTAEYQVCFSNTQNVQFPSAPPPPTSKSSCMLKTFAEQLCFEAHFTAGRMETRLSHQYMFWAQW